jgi:hypothetical protein
MAQPPPALPPSIRIDAARIRDLDLGELQDLRRWDVSKLVEAAGTLDLQFDWPRDPEDPRELSEIAELRLWSLRADALHPWLPLLLERSSGLLTRHVAMLLPHGFSRSEGIRFAPESLELWITHRLFLLDAWSQESGVPCRQKLAQMAAVLGFDLEPSFWDAPGLRQSPC